MRRPRRTVAIWSALSKGWRVKSPRAAVFEAPHLVVRQLEERRVLTIAPGAGLALAAVEIDPQAEVVVSTDPRIGLDVQDTTASAPLTSAAGHAAESSEVPAPAGHVASDSTEAESAAPAVTALVDNVNLIAPVLTVAGNQVTDEGALLSITNIGSFVDAGGEFPGEPVYNYTIDWGDGTPLDEGVATIDSMGEPGSPILGSFDGAHTYADNGVYTVTVTIANQSGVASDTLEVTVNNITPTLTVAPDQSIDEGVELAIINIGQFTDPGFDNPLNIGGETTERFTFAIDWGDGTDVDSGLATIDTPGGPGVLTAGSFDGAHTYADNGIYTVTVTLSDDDGGTVSETFTVTVNNVTPSLVVVPNQVVDEGTQLSITDIGQFTDPGFDNPLNVGGETTERFTFAVDWGDGTDVESGLATIDTPGGPGVLTAGSFDGAHTYADNGIYTVTVTISDDDGGTISDTFTVTVNNVAPTLVVAPDQVVDEGAQLTIVNLGQFTDPGFDNPKNEGGELTERFTFAIDWGDGTDVDSGLATIDTPGAPGVPTAGSFDGAHTYADNGIYTVTVTISDDDGSTTVETFNVTVNNVTPTLVVPPDQVVEEGTPLTITNIGQFTDPGFDNPLNVGGETTERFTFAVDWGDGTPVDSGPATIDVFGSAGVPTSGSFDGAHIYADNGVYTVTVTISDDDGGSISETFTVTVNNVTPTLVVPPNQVVDEGSLLSLPNIGQFTDPGFDNPLNVGGETTERFTFAVDWGDGTPVDSGMPTIDVPGAPGVPTSGSFDGSHIYADNGIYTVTVTISDDDGGSISETFTVTVSNVAPTLVVAPDQIVNEGALLSVPNIGQFTDPGYNNPLNVGGETTEQFTFAIDWGDGTPVDSGMPTIDVPGGPGVPTSGSFDGAHVYADNGIYTVTVTISDDDGGTTVETFSVTVNNVTPTLVVPPDQVVDEGVLLSLPNIGQFTDPGFDNPLNVGGETTERFTFAIDWDDGTPVDSGPATIDVFGSAGVPTSGSFDGAHTYLASGVYTVTVTLSDDDGGTIVQTFKVTVANTVPNLVAAPDQATNEGSLLSITDIGTFTDAFGRTDLPGDYNYTIDWGDGTPLDAGLATIDVPGAPGVPTAGSFDGSHIYADNGLYTVTITITDVDGNVASDTLLVTVANVAPALSVVPDQIAAEGALLSIPNIGQFNDPGFDNPLNVGGETTERFTFAIDWGDGSDVDSGSATIDVPGTEGLLTSGSFDGQHTYSSGGVYTVTVTISDDDGGTAVATLTVYIGPSLLAGGPHTVDEGSPLSIANIGQFSDPVPARLLPGGPEGASIFTYTINWGDGTAVDSGLATIDVPGAPGIATLGSFDGTHLYADNGLYTVTLSITSVDGRTDVVTLLVTVNNVAPTLVVVGDQLVAQTIGLSISDIGLFADPGFDNPLNVGGETTERFTFSIDWGDGTVDSSGPGTIDSPGGPGAATAGSFDGAHTFGAAGTFTVTVTVSDDDGGSATQSFNVVVAVITPQVFFTPGTGAGTVQIARPLPMDATPRPVPPAAINQSEATAYRIGTVAGAEPRLVLRVVLPSGEEDRDNDEPLATEVLDNLRKLFHRLPDGHYRIYLIQPDGLERLVVDVIVRGGRSIDPADDEDSRAFVPAAPSAPAELPDPAAAEPAAELVPTDSDESAQPATEPAGQPIASEPSAVKQDNVQLDKSEQNLEGEALVDRRIPDAWELGGGYFAYAAAGRFKYRLARESNKRDERALTKARRLFRRLR